MVAGSTPLLAEDQSLRGHTQMGRLPTALPAGVGRVGLYRYERVDTRGHPRVGQVLLTRQGISLDLLLRPADFSAGGPCFHMTSSRRREVRTISSPSSRSEGGWRMVSEDSHPLDESFLLIFRHGVLVTVRRWVVTVGLKADEYQTDTPGFPAYSQLHSPSSPTGGAANSSHARSPSCETLGRL